MRAQMNAFSVSASIYSLCASKCAEFFVAALLSVCFGRAAAMMRALVSAPPHAQAPTNSVVNDRNSKELMAMTKARISSYVIEAFFARQNFFRSGGNGYRN
eukprot:6206888-Pleurochrysis_carterae.AAC.1